MKKPIYLQRLAWMLLLGGWISWDADVHAQATKTTTTATETKVQVSGTVFDSEKEPLAGAAVFVIGGQRSWQTMTDSEGKFTLYLPPSAFGSKYRLAASYIGTQKQEFNLVKGRVTYQFVLKTDLKELDEVIVTGYGNVSIREKTSAITSLKMDDILMPGMTTIEQALEGRVPDLVFMQNSGEAGATARMRIRGTSTLIGNREPLWVLDGIPLSDPVDVTNEQLNDPDYINYIGNAISGINPQDIERVDVLKDAAATALYGTRAANGVIVVTTKKGEVGPARISYTSQMKFTARPRYTDKNINLMNSQERVQFGKDLVDLHYDFPAHMTMVGYEGAYHRYTTGVISYDEFLNEVKTYETANTDWFGLLTRNTLSHNHTVSLSGGGEATRYYASIGYNKEDGVVRSHKNDRYTASMNLNTKVANILSANLRVNASVQKKRQLPGEIDALGYAYNTTRALPSHHADGSLFYYQRHAYKVGTDKNERYKYRYNILNEIDNSENSYDASNLMTALDLVYRYKNMLDATLTTSYQRAQSDNHTWFGERTNYVAQLKNGEVEDAPIPGEYGRSDLPYGGVYNMKTSVNEYFTVRLQGNFRHSFGAKKLRTVNMSLGYELNTSNTSAYAENTRGFYKSRGMKYVDMTADEAAEFPLYARWLASNKPTHTADKLHRLSGYAILSYSHGSLFSVSANGRFDASNKFGSRSNEKFLPVWSLSGMLNFKHLLLKKVTWLDDLRLRTSYGKTGNMVAGQTPNLLLRQGGMDTYYGENISTVHALPNPNLRWEQTNQYNLGLEMNLFNYRLSIGADVYHKHTEDAFNQISVPTVNGLSDYVMNGTDIYNIGMSIYLTGYPVRNRDWTWSVSTNYSVVANRVEGKSTSDFSLDNYLNGTAIIDGRPIGTFYSYRFLGLNPRNGTPMFDDYSDRRYLLEKKSLGEIMNMLLVDKGSREPYLTGSVSSSLRWKQLTLNANFNYSLGNKIRKFALYENIMNGVSSENNVRKEFTERWLHPGDEKYTNYPALLSLRDPEWADYRYHWSTIGGAGARGFQTFAKSHWSMYDHADIRVVPGDYLRLSQLSLRYQFTAKQLRSLPISNLGFDFSVTNVFTLKSKELDGQDPTQSGFSINTALSLRPSYTLGVRVAF